MFNYYWLGSMISIINFNLKIHATNYNPHGSSTDFFLSVHVEYGVVLGYIMTFICINTHFLVNVSGPVYKQPEKQ